MTSNKTLPRIWTVRDILVMAGVAIGSLALSIAFVYLIEPRVDYVLLLIDAVFSLSIIGVHFALARRKGLGLREIGLVPIKFRWLLLAFGLGILFVFGSLVTASGLSSIFGIEDTGGTSLGDFGNMKTWVTILNLKLFIAVLLPVAEELLFRGGIFRVLRQNRRFWPAALISSVIFGILHIHPFLMVFAFLLGIISCGLFERTGSLFPSMLFHIVINNIAANALVYAMI